MTLPEIQEVAKKIEQSFEQLLFKKLAAFWLLSNRLVKSHD
jgi:hypothetical protein